MLLANTLLSDMAALPLRGTLLNFATVMLGGIIGLLIGDRLPERIKQGVIIVIGIMTIVIGMSSALKTENALIPLLALVIGVVVGELLNIDGGINWLGDLLKRRVDKTGREQHFTAAFVVASLQFCVGPLTILGSIQDGLTGDFRLLAIKAILDGFSAIIFASSFGRGVLFAGATVLIVQGGISLLAGLIKPLLISNPALALGMQPRVIELSAAGGTILIALALNILGIQSQSLWAERIKVANMLPALLIAPLLVALLNILHISLDFGLGG
ncbi:hypothetical protein KSC_038090 [Ktedonobacter sp. SOSP1-52]|uniref:DUF554 domain-containing protein n=1 Tax=Ktedonobacter sp. SOSP1-52 TaxID=2778366 RepID=UPI0019160C06|nr:DUF554 domain-containing protein [Ktedonobacter sp. SOSP1-52]GHO64917.1 hypothetical protein KSC_038090 [Ktedonobacter sp. SOSP1-52]